MRLPIRKRLFQVRVFVYHEIYNLPVLPKWYTNHLQNNTNTCIPKNKSYLCLPL